MLRRRLIPLLIVCAAPGIWAQPAIDFSYAGYGGGGVALPSVPAVIAVRPTGGDDTRLLQSAIDAGGVVLLRPGRYRVAGHLQIRHSGVVLRGSGNATIVATGTGRRTLIEIGSESDPVTVPPVSVTDETVSAGARTMTLENLVENPGALRPGDRVVITRPSTAAWISSLKMSGLPGTYANQRLDWLPGSRNLVWDRTVTAVDTARKQITVDAPITTALERRYGGGTVARISSSLPVAHVGIENLTLECEYDPTRPRDEEHSWIAVALDHVEDAWVRGVVARHFAGSAVRVGQRARRVTVEDCRSEQPVSEPGGYRRQSFLIEGQQVLVWRVASEQGMNDFAIGLLAAGPNVFLDATAAKALGPSGSFESWASGVLYERVHIEGAEIRLTQDSTRAQGGGWTAANSVVWNSDARELEVRGPDGAENVVRRSAEPLYESQLLKRTGVKLTTSQVPVDSAAVPDFKPPRGAAIKAAASPASSISGAQIVNGRFVVNGKTLWGGAVNDGWWRGQANPATSLDVGGVALTRFVPGRTGPGLTEDLAALAAQMVAQDTPFFQSIPGLWYDRRRDEHSVNSRADANVQAPFYEMPWARSGKGTAADGLSLFDLSQFNPWYYERLREFGRLSDENGLVLYHHLYNTHNLLEIEPHWVDYPWRAVNNVNNTGLPEPPPLETGNKLHVANQVYDIGDPTRRDLHRAFILHELDELGATRNLFFSLGAQFSGPLSFQEFFQDTVAEWEKKTGRRARIELATSKDITDAILADPARARQVAVIDMRYWQYRPDGSLWAPPGGKNLAFREMIAADFGRTEDAPPNTTPLQVYRQVREYHDRYPDKAIVAWNSGAGPIPILMAGGAEALMRNPSAGHGQGKTVDRTPLDVFVRDHLAAVLMNMNPKDGVAADPERTWAMADASGESVLMYSLAGPSIRLVKALSRKRYTGLWFDPRTGATEAMGSAVTVEAGSVIRKPTEEPWMLLLRVN